MKKKNKKNTVIYILERINKDKLLYAMLLPVLIWYLIFCYMPMGGLSLAFKNYKFNMGLWKSPFIGFTHFKTMFADYDFWRAFKNTIIFSLGKLVLHFPTPIILAILLNEITRMRTKKVFQTVLTFPHFISWVVLSGILINMFGSTGIINNILQAMGLRTVSPLMSKSSFRPFIWISNIWKEVGWDSIIYLAALAGIDPTLYEAASIDGANKFQSTIHITWPSIRGTVAIMLILAVGSIMSSGASFDQVFNLYSAPVYSVADTIDTYVYRASFTVGLNFGYTTAIGFLKSIINMVLIVVANKTVKAMGEDGLL